METEEKEQIVKDSTAILERARAIEAMLSSTGWKVYTEILAKRKQQLVDKSFKSEFTVKQHEYGRGFVVETEKAIDELKGLVEDAVQAKENLDEVKDIS